MSEERDEIGSVLLKEYVLEVLQSGKRIDGRDPLEMREISVERGTFTKSYGEAWLSLGRTKVLVGISLDVGEPFPDTPNKCVFVSNVELLPLASPNFEPGPPEEYSIELARVVDRAFRSANAIDFEKLVIEPGKLVYTIFLDMYVLDHKGNLADALTLASLVALMRTRVPRIELGPEGNVVVKEEFFPMPVINKPVSFTFVKIGNYLLLDPSLEEETIADSIITLAVDDQGRICSIQLRKGYFTDDEIKKAYEIARERMEEVRSKLEEVI